MHLPPNAPAPDCKLSRAELRGASGKVRVTVPVPAYLGVKPDHYIWGFPWMQFCKIQVSCPLPPQHRQFLKHF